MEINWDAYVKRSRKYYGIIPDIGFIENRLANYIDKKQKKDFRKQITKYGTHFRRILDLGCGTGRFTGFLSSFADEVVGVDGSEVKIKIAKKTNNKKIKFILKNFEDLKFENNFFDLIMLMGVMTDVSDRNLKKIIEKMSHWVERGGYIFLYELMFDFGENFVVPVQLDDEIYGYRTLRPSNYYIKLLETNGFNLIKKRKMYFGLFPIKNFWFLVDATKDKRILNKLVLRSLYLSSNFIEALKYLAKPKVRSEILIFQKV